MALNPRFNIEQILEQYTLNNTDKNETADQIINQIEEFKKKNFLKQEPIVKTKLSLENEYNLSNNSHSSILNNKNYTFYKIKKLVSKEIKITKKNLSITGLVVLLINGYCYYYDQKEQSQMNKNIKIIMEKIDKK